MAGQILAVVLGGFLFVNAQDPLVSLPGPTPQEEVKDLTSQVAPSGNPAHFEVKAFLEARQKDISAGRRSPHQDMLRSMTRSKDITERLWALGRLVEAGDLTVYEEYGQAMVLHIRATVQARSGHASAKAQRASLVIGAGAPEATHISPKSPFWKALANTLQQDSTVQVDQILYSVWCYNTLPSQRDLIRLVAPHIASKVSIKSQQMDPWSDPRFWIVTDWAITWGTSHDFAQLEGLIKDPFARREFARRFKELQKIQSYLPCLVENQARANVPTGDSGPFEALPKEMAEKLKNFGAAKGFHFSQIKVNRQPSAPAYPVEAQARKLMADMQVEITIDPTGSPCMVRMRPGPFLAFFAPTCLEYSETWRFQPATLNGIPQYAKFLLTMPFRLR